MTTARRIDPRNNSVVLTPKSIEIPESWEVVKTEEEKLAQDRAHNAFKDDPRWGDLTVHFAHSEEVQMDRSRL